MHKKQAAKLFRILGNEDQLKILKKIYTNEIMSYDEIFNIMEIDQEQLNNHLQTLIDNELISNKNNIYCCNKILVDELMSFVTTPCKCQNKLRFKIIAYDKEFVFNGKLDSAWYNFDHVESINGNCKLRIDADREVYGFFLKDGKEIQGVIKDDDGNVIPDNYIIDNNYTYHFVECEKQGYYI